MSNMVLSDQIAIQLLLQNLSAELAALAEAALAIEDQVGDAVSSGPATSDRIATALQGLDQVAQTATELARFVGAIARSVDGTISVSISDHVRAIRLRALAQSLSGAVSDKMGHVESAGDVDLF